MFLDLGRCGDDDGGWARVYDLCVGFINPRPIALVSTVSAEGLENVAPYSFYMMVSARPPVVMFCPGLRRDGSPRDSLRNAEATGEFVVATVTPAIVEQMADCSTHLPHGRSEFAFSGLTPVPATRVNPSLVAEAKVNIECTVNRIVSFGDEPGAGQAVFGDIVAMHVADDVLGDGAEPIVDPAKLTTVGRLGGAYYCTSDPPFRMEAETA